jgi:uncharacterized membrane protein
MNVDAAMKMIITVGVVAPQDMAGPDSSASAESPKPPARIARGA